MENWQKEWIYAKGMQGKQTEQQALIHSINMNLLISQKICVSNGTLSSSIITSITAAY
jgi:hypothetical protein